MTTPQYCHFEDVLRALDLRLDEGDTRVGEIGDTVQEKVEEKIADAGDQLESDTRHAWRERAVGRQGQPGSYEYHDVNFRRSTGGLRLRLNHREVVPIDAAEGDKIEVLTGKDQWKDITGDQGSRWTLHESEGTLQIYFRIAYPRRYNNMYFSDNVRVRYRYGALGGRRESGGETTLDGNITDTTTTITVNDPGRLPRRGVLLLDNNEYIRYEGFNGSDLTNVSRGERQTDATAHDDGAVVHYAPLDVRRAVASAAAADFIRTNDYNQLVSETQGSIDVSTKMEELKQDYQRTVATKREMEII